MSSQARVLVVQASIAVYLQDLPSRVSFPMIRSTRENKEMTTNELRTRTFFHVSSTKNSIFGSQVAGFASNQSCLKYWLLPPFFYEEATCKGSTVKGLLYPAKSSTIKGLLYAPDPDKCKKRMLSNQPQQSRVTSTELLCCWGHSCSKIWHPLWLTLRCMPYGRGTLRIPLQRIL